MKQPIPLRMEETAVPKVWIIQKIDQIDINNTLFLPNNIYPISIMNKLLSPFPTHARIAYTISHYHSFPPLHHIGRFNATQVSVLKLCNSSPSRFLAAVTDTRCPKPNRLRIVRREVLSSSSNLTSSNGASDRVCSSTLAIEGRSLLPVRDEMDPLRVLRLESRLKRGEFANVDVAARVGEVPPTSNDLRYPYNEFSPEKWEEYFERFS
jgi:hypothetical protein